MQEQPLFQPQAQPYRTQYAELKERSRLALVAGLTAGSPGSLKTKTVNGSPQLYRVFYASPGDRREEWIASGNDSEAEQAARDQVEFAQWVEEQVKTLRKLRFQVADKNVAKVLIELHNKRLFEAGLTLVGTLAVMAWYNELGITTTTARTEDIDLARRQHLKLGVPVPLLATLQSTGLRFVAVPEMPSHRPSSTAAIPGRQGLRVDLLVPGHELGASVPVPELEWAAQAVPFLDYLIDEPEDAWMLAGSHCIPVRLPQAARLFWHKLFSSVHPNRVREKAAKDFEQALVLGAAVSDESPSSLRTALRDAPPALMKKVLPLRERILARISRHDEFVDIVADLPLPRSQTANEAQAPEEPNTPKP